jgi:hypothetical protein
MRLEILTIEQLLAGKQAKMPESSIMSKIKKNIIVPARFMIGWNESPTTKMKARTVTEIMAKARPETDVKTPFMNLFGTSSTP